MSSSERSIFHQYLAQTSPAPLGLEIVSAQGHYLKDASGKEYLDLISGISVCNLGHQNPELIEAAKAQLDRHMHVMVYGELIQKPQNDLAIALSKTLPPEFNAFYFTNSGAEAVDGAMKLAKRYTGRQGFIAQTDAYHGSSQGPLSLMSNEYYSPKFRPLLPNIHFIRQNHPEDLHNIGDPTNIAAIIIEIIQAEKGAHVAQKGYLQALRQFCDEHEILLVYDEIQTGMGRTGSMYAFEHYEIVPDILLLGKALGGGMPMGVFICRRELMAKLADFPVLGHITTFGGHPVCCAVGAKAVELTAAGLESFHVAEKEKLFRQLLQHPRILGIQGKGLLLSVEFKDHEAVKQLIDACLDHGLFTDWFLYAPYCLRICPPLTITEEEIRIACRVILDGL